MAQGHSIVLDVETTGFAKKDRIWEIAAIKFNREGEIGVFHKVINPELFIPAFITDLTGATNEMVQAAPKYHEISEEFNDFVMGCPIIAYNSSFDRRFLIKEDINFRYRKFYDYLKYVRKVRPDQSSYKLVEICKSFRIPIAPHRALDDTRALYHLIKILGYPYER